MAGKSEWKHGNSDVLHQRLGANADINAGEIVLEVEPGGGDLIDETAKSTTLDVNDLCGEVVLGVSEAAGRTLSVLLLRSTRTGESFR